MSGTVARRDGGQMETVKVTDDNFPALVEGVSGVVEVLAENVGGALALTDLTRVPIPPGGGSSWEVPDELTGETESAKEIIGVPVYWQAARVWWPAPAAGEPEVTGAPPECSSADGKHPVYGGAFGDGGARADENPPVEGVRACEGCPMNQWGSDHKGTRGKACKEQRLLFLLRQGTEDREGDTLPTLVAVPPTSLAALRRFMVGLTARQRAHYSGFLLSLGLEAKTNATGQKYAMVKPKLVGKLDGVRPTTRGGPVEGSAAHMAYQYSQGFAKLLSPETVVAAAAAQSSTDDDAGGLDDLPPDGRFGGDFADHGDVADPVGDDTATS